jgi:hypothetical protein
MKNLILSLIAISVITVQCRKDDDSPEPVVYPEENPLALYHTNAGFTASSNFINAGDYEFGLVFSPNVKGKINSIVLQLPDVNQSVRVTLWDYDTKTVLKSEIVSVSTANTVVTKTIASVILEKDKKYLISMNSNDWYKRNKPDNGNAVYPVSAGNIKFWEYRWVSGVNQVFPTNVSLNYNGGDLSFNFQQTE